MGTKNPQTLQRAALTIAIIDLICTAILLILFVLGSSLMVAYGIVGKGRNATRVLDIVTDDVFGTVQKNYNTWREKKDVAEDMGVWLIVMFLTMVDFTISCIFLDGVRNRDERKCQTWFQIRIVILVVFKIIMLINLIYGTSILTAIPDLVYTCYRIGGLYIGYQYLEHLQSLNPIPDTATTKAKQRALSMMVTNGMPVLKVTDESGHCGDDPEASHRSSLSSVGIMMTPCSSSPHGTYENGGLDTSSENTRNQLASPSMKPKVCTLKTS